MLVSDGIHHIQQGGPMGLELGLGIKTYMCILFVQFQIFIVICSQYHTQVLQASFSCTTLGTFGIIF